MKTAISLIISIVNLVFIILSLKRFPSSSGTSFQTSKNKKIDDLLSKLVAICFFLLVLLSCF